MKVKSPTSLSPRKQCYPASIELGGTSQRFGQPGIIKRSNSLLSLTHRLSAFLIIFPGSYANFNIFRVNHSTDNSGTTIAKRTAISGFAN